MSCFVPVNQPIISKAAKDCVIDALDSGWISSAGPYVKKFEEAFADKLGVRHAITVNTGTAALHIALLASGVQRGDEVIVPAFTMAATWLAVLYVGAKPVFVDCEDKTYNINPLLIEEKITSRTKAIIPVHIYGHPAEMTRILNIANKHNLIVIEDAAEAHGAQYENKKCGSMGDINCFSFYANKLVATGEGGMVVTNNDDLAHEARKLKDLYHSEKKRFIHEKMGYNYRMTNLQAAVGFGELQHLDEYIEKKQKMGKKYNQLLKEIPGIRTPITKPNALNSYWMYAITIDEDIFRVSKDTLRKKLLEKGIDTRDFFYPPTQQPLLSNHLSCDDRFPISDRISTTGLYLPSGLAITNEQIDFVCETLSSLQLAENT